MQHLELYSNKLQIILQYQLNSCHIHLNISKPQCKLSNLVTSAFIYTIFTVQALFFWSWVNITAQKHRHTHRHIDRQNIQYQLAETKQTFKCKRKRKKKLIENSTRL